MKYQIGEIILADDPVIINKDRVPVEVAVTNNGDRTIQVCSHYHFFEVNLALEFEREKAIGMRLDIPSGTAVRFEPGEEKIITLIPYTGDRRVIGFKGVTMGNVDDPIIRKNALAKMDELVKGGGK